MDLVDLMEQARRINLIRSLALDKLEKIISKDLISQIKQEGYFIARPFFKGEPEEYYVIVDFTSKQIEHLHDFDNYTTKIYKNFLDEPHYC